MASAIIDAIAKNLQAKINIFDVDSEKTARYQGEANVFSACQAMVRERARMVNENISFTILQWLKIYSLIKTFRIILIKYDSELVYACGGWLISLKYPRSRKSVPAISHQ